MTLTEVLALLALIISFLGLIVTVIYDTIDIVLRIKEFQTKIGQKKWPPTLAQADGHSFDDMPVRS